MISVLRYLEFLIIVDEREWKRHVQRIVLKWVCRSLPRLEGDHQVDPTSWSLRTERLDELAAKDPDQQPLKLKVNS